MGTSRCCFRLRLIWVPVTLLEAVYPYLVKYLSREFFVCLFLSDAFPSGFDHKVYLEYDYYYKNDIHFPPQEPLNIAKCSPLMDQEIPLKE